MMLDEIKKRYSGLQDDLGIVSKTLKDGACLLLSLCSIIDELSDKPCDIIEVINTAWDNKWMKWDYELIDSLALLNHFTGKRFSRTEVTSLPSVIKDNEFTIEKWYNPDTKYTHFKRRFVDTLKNSKTVKEGYIKEYYIYSYKV